MHPKAEESEAKLKPTAYGVDSSTEVEKGSQSRIMYAMRRYIKSTKHFILFMYASYL